MTPEALATLHAACFVIPRPFTVAEFRRLLDDPAYFLCPAHHGFALGRAAAGEAELLTVAVAPAARRQGLGRRLLAAFEAEAGVRDAEVAFLEVAADNIPARALYAECGFAIVGHRRNYYRAPDGSGIDAMIMRKALRRT